MKSCKPILAVVALAALAYAGYHFLEHKDKAQPPVAPSTETQTETPVEDIKEAVIEANALESGKYEVFSAETQNALAGEPHVIFFHANWCSWCRARDKEIMAAIDALPANTRILKADFDKNTELKQTYGVTQQDTFIFVDADGEPTLKNGSSVETIENFFINSEVTPGEERPQGLGGYFEYDVDTVATFKDRKPYALFFHASWCPPCRALDKEITESLAELPKNTNIFKVDYDSSDELKKLYGVTQQHTFVYFNKAGEVEKVEAGTDLEDVIAYFQ